MQRLLAVLLPVMMCLSPVAGQTDWQLPQEPVAQAATKLLDAIVSGDRSTLETLVRETFSPQLRDAYPMEAHCGFLEELSQQLGKFTIVAVDIPTSQRLKLQLMPESGGSPTEIMIEISETSPYQITGINVGGAGDKDIPFKNLAELSSYLDQETAENRFSGAVLVLHGDSLLFQQAYGFANREKKLPNRLSTEFNIGSINKEFTAVAIAQLAEKGKLDLDDNISRWLPDFPKPAAEKITIRQLLQHRAGTGDYLMQDNFRKAAAAITTVDQLYQLIKDQPLLYKPGQSQQYSNSGYVVLGRIVEAAADIDYYEFVRKNIYRPAKMEHSESYDFGTHTDQQAIAYSALLREDGSPPFGADFFNKKGSPAGGGYATVEDLARFDRALREHQLLSPRYTALLVNRFRPLPENAGPGGGLGIAGGAPGVNAILESDWDNQFTVVVAANMDPPVAEDLGIAIMDMLRQQ